MAVRYQGLDRGHTEYQDRFQLGAAGTAGQTEDADRQQAEIKVTWQAVQSQGSPLHDLGPGYRGRTQQKSRQLGGVRIEQERQTASDSQEAQVEYSSQNLRLTGPESCLICLPIRPTIHKPSIATPARTPPCKFTQTAMSTGSTQSFCSRPGTALSSKSSSS